MKTKLFFISLLTFLELGIIAPVVVNAQVANSNKKENRNSKSKPIFKIKTFQNNYSEWGYDILKDGILIIHQPDIPAVSGVHGFKSEADALKIAHLMKSKMEQNIMPPTIDMKDLNKLKINY
jgi:hypothetical protein